MKDLKKEYYDKLKNLPPEIKRNLHKAAYKCLKESIDRSKLNPKGSLVRELINDMRKECGLPDY